MSQFRLLLSWCRVAAALPRCSGELSRRTAWLALTGCWDLMEDGARQAARRWSPAQARLMAPEYR